MNIKKLFIPKVSLVALSVLTLHTASYAQADDSSRPSREQMHAAFEECASSAGLEKPAAGQRPTAPTEEQRAVMDACLKEKGIQPPSRMGGGPRGGGPREPSSAQSGVQ
ncbi:MAG: hypothetical protein J7501_17475 [Bdellovibrio sp.]|nr:hypothetical protein [Bdellovibrio sp.]